MEGDLDQVRESFLAESEEDFAAVEQALLVLEKSHADRESLALVFRKFHTLKGNALAVGLESLGDFAHRIEDLLVSVREGAEPVTEELVSFLLAVVDATRAAIPALLAGRQRLPSACDALLRRIKSGHLAKGPTLAPSEAGAEGEATQELARMLRIEARRLDQLLSVTSEIAIARGRLGVLIEEQGSPELAGSYRSLAQLLGDLHHFVTSVRLVPVAPLLQHYQRVVRDLALEQHKEVDLFITDQGVEVDTSVLEQIKAPLTQMVRNAVHHGIETPAQRKSIGKSARGRIDLRVRYEASGIVVEVEDDGKGLDRAAILEKAQALGLVSDAASLSDNEVEQLIFRAGLSTAKRVSSASGRGVGMDVVRRNLDALGGSADVRSQPGQGTIVTMCMPLTLATIDGLLVGAGNETFVVPLASVLRCIDLPASQTSSVLDGVVEYRGRALPFVRLRTAFGIEGQPSQSEIVVVVERGSGEIGIVVDRLIRKEQLVVKPPCLFFRGLPTLSGMTILRDGQVAAILNVGGLLQGLREHATDAQRLSDPHQACAAGERSGGRAAAQEDGAAPARGSVYLTLFLGDEEYGVPLSRVREVLPSAEMTRVPSAPSFVAGLVNFNGAAVPVVDVATKFGARRIETEGNRSIVVIRAQVHGDALLVGLLTDRLGRIVPLAADAVRPRPSLDAIVTIEFLLGVFEADGHFVLCLDVDRILGTDEAADVAELAQGASPVPAGKHVTRLSLLTARLAGERCAMRLASLREILPCGRITAIPGAAPFVLGATNVRGSIVPVIDMAQRHALGAARQAAGSCLVLVAGEGNASEAPAALIVDAIEGLEHVVTDKINSTPPFGTRFPAALVEGMAPMAGGLVPIVDVERELLSDAGNAAGGV